MLLSPSLPTADGHGGATSTIATIHPDIIRHHILSRLDGAALAAASCASSEFLSLCNNEYLWKRACNSTWPSTADPRVRHAIAAFTDGHRSFFSDAFPALRCCHSVEYRRRQPVPQAPELISAVDIHSGDGEAIFSKVMVTETTSSWFLNTPFRLDLLDSKETITIDVGGGATSHTIGPPRLSWILIDPVRRRAVNVASHEAVESRRHWLTGYVQLRYATVVAGVGKPVMCAVVVTCGARAESGGMHVRDVSMHVEDMEGKIVAGREALGILAVAAEGRCRRGDGGAREKDIYEGFVRMKMELMEKRETREKGLDMVCIAVGIFILCVLFWVFWHCM